MKAVAVLVTILLPSCIAFPTYAPPTTCETMFPKHNDNVGKPHNTSPYTVSVSTNSYTANSLVNVTVAGALFHGFLVQARREGASGPPYPIGTFKSPFPDKTSHIWCSGGEPMNTVRHKHPSKASFTSLQFTWQAPPQGAGDVRFYVTAVQKFDSFWVKMKSDLITGPAAIPPPNATLQSDFEINKQGCGVSKGCYSIPPSCTSSEDCIFLLTYQNTGDNVTFEMSSSMGYAAVGFNVKQEMNNTDAIICTKLATSEVVVRSYFLDYHSLVRNDLSSYQDISPISSVYNNGIIKCRFSRKKVPQEPKMLHLTNNHYFIFSFGKAYSTGENAYHGPQNASYSNETVDVTKYLTLTNGRPPKPAPVPSPGQITKTGCGKTKGCFSVPENCKSSDDCQYLLTYTSDKTKITFDMSTKSGWVAVGFNSKDKMDGTDAIICSRDAAGSGVQVAHYDISGYSSPKKNLQGTSDLTDKAGKVENEILICKTSRLITQSGMRDLAEKVFMIFAHGPASGGVIRRHTYKSVTAERVDVSAIQALTSAEKNVALIKAHAVLMSIAWILCASLGMFMARYMKPVWGDLFGKKAWFQLHRLLMVTAVLLTIIAVILAFVYAEGWSEAYDAHPIIGMIVLILAVVQPIMAIFRPGPTADSRFIFNYAHRSVGVTALVLAVINCFLGVVLPHFNIKDIGIYPLIVYCVGAVLVLVFEIVLRFKSQNSHDLQHPKAQMAGEKVEIETRKPLADPDNNKNLKKAMFGFVVILVVACCLALIILLARGG